MSHPVQHPAPRRHRVRSGHHAIRLLRDQRGLSTVEYVIILALIAVAAIPLWRSFSGSVTSQIGNATTGMGTLNNPPQGTQ